MEQPLFPLFLNHPSDDKELYTKGTEFYDHAHI